jgi:hypothetical protein
MDGGMLYGIFSTVHLIAKCRCEPPILFVGGEAISS